jgi:transcriptional regulator with XRE-family HTH domain
MELRRTFAANIRDRRKALGWSQEQLAFESGLHRTYISGIERGLRNVSIDNIELIASALDTTPGNLLVGRAPVKNKASQGGRRGG